MKFLTKISLSILLAASAASPLYAEDAKVQSAAAPEKSELHATMSEGEIRKINKEIGKVTIKHGPLQNLDMPGMTMLFRLQDPAMFDQIKEGDKIKFVADKIDGTFVVKSLQVEK